MPLGIFISRESACLKNLSYKPALNYLDISCPSLTSQAISQSVLSRLEFLGYYRSAVAECASRTIFPTKGASPIALCAPFFVVCSAFFA